MRDDLFEDGDDFFNGFDLDGIVPPGVEEDDVEAGRIATGVFKGSCGEGLEGFEDLLPVVAEHGSGVVDDEDVVELLEVLVGVFGLAAGDRLPLSLNTFGRGRGRRRL